MFTPQPSTRWPWTVPLYVPRSRSPLGFTHLESRIQMIAVFMTPAVGPHLLLWSHSDQLNHSLNSLVNVSFRNLRCFSNTFFLETAQTPPEVSAWEGQPLAHPRAHAGSRPVLRLGLTGTHPQSTPLSKPLSKAGGGFQCQQTPSEARRGSPGMARQPPALCTPVFPGTWAPPALVLLWPGSVR